MTEKNIVEAIAAENRYLNDKINENMKSSLYDYLEPYGYDTLSEFRDDKLMYLVRELEPQVVSITSDQIENRGDTIFLEYFHEHSPYLLWNTQLNRNMAYLPISCQKTYDGFKTIRPGYDCDPDRGNILSFDGDLDIVLTAPNQLADFFKKVMEFLAETLSSYTKKHITLDGNDIMVDNKKVIGLANARDDEYSVAMIHISFTDNDDIVKKLCPSSLKEPGHIDFMHPEKIMEHMIAWLQRH